MKKKKHLAGLFAIFALLTSAFFTSCDDAAKLIDEISGEKFTITYVNEKGENPESITKKENSTFTEEDLPELEDVEGFTFDYWKIQGTTTKVEVGFKVTKNLTLVAVWKAKSQGDEPNPPAEQKFTITYENDKGEVPAPIQKSGNSTFSELDLPELEDVEGFTFNGWKIKNTATKVKVGDKVTGNFILVAIWKAKTQGDEPNPPAVEYNKITDNGDSYIIENPLFTCEQNPEKKLTTNEIIYNRDNNENGYFIKIDKLNDYQILELTYKGGLLKTDEENVIAVMFDKYLTYNHRMGGDRKNVTAASQTIQIDIPQGIGIDVFIIQQKYNTNNPDWGDTNLNLPLGWEKDFSFFVEKIELKKDSSKIPYTITTSSDSYIIENPQLQNVWHSEITGNKVSFKSEDGLKNDNNDFTSVYWEFPDIAEYDKAIITVKGSEEGFLSFAGYSPYNYNSASMAEEDMHDYHSYFTNSEQVEEWTSDRAGDEGTVYHISRFALDLKTLVPNDNGKAKPYKALEIINEHWTEKGRTNWNIEVEKIELYKLNRSKSDLVIFDPSKKDTYSVTNDYGAVKIEPDVVTGPDGNKYLTVTPNGYSLGIELNEAKDISDYLYVKALVYAEDDTDGNWVSLGLRDFSNSDPFPLQRSSHDLSNDAENYPILYSGLIKGIKATGITAFVQNKKDNYNPFDNKTIYIGKIIVTNNNDKNYNPFIGDKAESSIVLDVKVPAYSGKVEIQRREVDKFGYPLSAFEEVGAQWPKYNDSENWTKNQIKQFTDRYTVQNGHYYEYQAISYGENWNIINTQKLGVHLAAYDGYPKPELSTENYPEITWEKKEDGVYFTIQNDDVLSTVDFKGGATPVWITHNLRFQHYYGSVSVTPWLGCDDNQKSFKVPKAEYENAPTGIYNLTEFVVDDQFADDYFDARFFYDVSKLNKDKIVTSIAHEPEEMENGGFKMTIQLPYGYDGYDKISDVTLQCREKPADPKKQYDWPINLAEYQTRKGRLDGGVFNGRVSDSGLVEFYDYFGFKAGKNYQYRAIVRAEGYTNPLDIPLGEVWATKDSWAYPTFKNNVKPEFSWDAENETISITNTPELVPSAELFAEWGCADDDWEWCITLGYEQEEDAEQGYWPWFVLKYANGHWDKLYKSQTVEDWHSYTGKKYTLKAIEYYVDLYIPGKGISQNIVLNPGDLGDAVKLTR